MSDEAIGDAPSDQTESGKRPPLSSTFLPFLVILASASLLTQHGFSLGESFNLFFHSLDLLIAFCVALEVLLNVLGAPRLREALHARRFELAVLALLLVTVGIVSLAPSQAEEIGQNLFHIQSLSGLLLGLVKLYLLAAIFFQVLKVLQLMIMQGVRAELVLAGSLASLILAGTALLLLPRSSSTSAPPLSFIDALFTSTSAACVTGLVVRDTGTAFSTLGQFIILALFQVGGLGIITFVAFVSVFSARTLPVSQMVAFKQMINTPALSDLKRRILGVVLLTFVVEAVGAACLYALLTNWDPEDVSGRLFWSVFHSISAFCTAGFGLHADSLERFAGSPSINIVIMALAVLGGLGFLLIPEVCSLVLHKTSQFFRRILSRKKEVFVHQTVRLSIQSRLALRVTLWLTIGGTFGILLLEGNHLMQEFSWEKAALVSLFQSVTPRTIGFNTVPIAQLRDATLLLIIILMVIGASPVSAGGGIKTVTFGVLLLALRAMISGHDRVEVFGRRLPTKTLVAALSVFVIYVMTAACTTLLLAVFEPHFVMRDHLFESISALSTVGLSTGVTPHLSTPSKIVLCVAMFVGRIGPISLVLSVFRAKATVDYDFPTEDVVVG